MSDFCKTKLTISATQPCSLFIQDVRNQSISRDGSVFIRSSTYCRLDSADIESGIDVPLKLADAMFSDLFQYTIRPTGLNFIAVSQRQRARTYEREDIPDKLAGIEPVNPFAASASPLPTCKSPKQITLEAQEVSTVARKRVDQAVTRLASLVCDVHDNVHDRSA